MASLQVNSTQTIPRSPSPARERRTQISAPYEDKLSADTRWALSEGSRHFEGNSAVFDALHNITQRLEELGISYAVVGGMALFRHGFRRFTENVDILISREDLKKVHQELKGRSYRAPFEHSKNLRDTANGVKIEFLLVGDYPGDGKPKPVAFPAPESVSSKNDGVRSIDLVPLIELKLASGMTESGRLKDLADVIELIKLLGLPQEFSEQLNPYVQERFKELWGQGKKRYIRRLAPHEFAEEQVSAMQQAGIVIEDTSNDSIQLVTTDPEIAGSYGLIDEAEYW